MPRPIAALALAVAACGSSRPAPQPPRPPDPVQIARDLHTRMTEMAELVHRLRDACPKLAGELRVLFGRMRLTVDEASRAAQDPALAKQLTTELRAYDEADRGLPDAIAADLAACRDDPAVREVMSTMPTLPP
jgi:hypothetical protein